MNKIIVVLERISAMLVCLIYDAK